MEVTSFLVGFSNYMVIFSFRVFGARIGLMVNGVTIAVTLWSEAPTVQAMQEKLLIRYC